MKSRRSSASEIPKWVLPVKHLLWGFAWLIVAFYAFVWISMPDKKVGYKYSDKVYHAFEKNKQWGGPGATMLQFSAPILVLAIVSCVSLELDKSYPTRKRAKAQRSGRLRRLWDGLFLQPLMVRGPMGMMNAVEIVGFAMVLFVVMWQFWKYTLDWFKVIDAGETGNTDSKLTNAMMKLEYISVMLGWVSMIPIALLFLPVTRGSPILKLIDIPFEHAVKYHVWLGHLTLILVLGHGVAYLIYYSLMNEAHLFVKWQKMGIANLPGVIALVAGLFMWPTSLARVRRHHFNLFFSVHQLYIVFFVFAVYHLGGWLTGYFLGGALLFFIDRFLRFLQSRRSIGGVKARVLPTGIVELKLPVSPSNSYNPLSFMFINLRGLAKGLATLEWHPFSTASTPLDNTKYMSVLIKPLGDWTDNLRKAIEESKDKNHSQVNSERKCPISLKLFAEGPYGHESNYFLSYNHLLLVAGGIGVTPFMAIITDILHRQQNDEVGLPTTVDLIWCVKTRSELNAFKRLFCDPAEIFTNYGSTDSDFRVNVKIFLTGEKPDAEAVASKAMEEVSFELQEKVADNNGFVEITAQTVPSGGVEEGGSGNNLTLFACVTAASCLGLTLFLALFRVYVYLPNSDIVEYTYELANYHDVSLYLLSIAIAVIIFGGTVVYGAKLGSKFLLKSSTASLQSRELRMVQDGFHGEDFESSGRLETLLDRSTVVVGSRPNFTEVIGEVRDLHGNTGGGEVGVLVCGPETLTCTVAELCRSMNFSQFWSRSTTQFHYHSVSFDL